MDSATTPTKKRARKNSLGERVELLDKVSAKKQRYVLAWFLIGFWCAHFIAAAVIPPAYYHPVPNLVRTLNYGFVGALLFLGGDEALRIFEKAKNLKEKAKNDK